MRKIAHSTAGIMNVAPALGVFMATCVLAASVSHGQSRAQLISSAPDAPRPNINQATLPAGQASVNAISTSVQISGPYGTSVLAPDASGAPLTLTIEDAIQRGLRYNLGSVEAAARRQSAQASEIGARSGLLPDITGALSENVDRVNLSAQGFDESTLPAIGSYFPSAIGPFHYYSAQAQLSQNAFDLVTLRNYMAARNRDRAAALSEHDAREQVVLAVAAMYLQVLAQAARVESAEAQVKYAQSIYDQAVQQKDAGAKSTIDVNRSRVELQSRQLRLLAQTGEEKKEKMGLARLLGLAVDREFTLAASLGGNSSEIPDLSTLYQRAMERYDLKSTEALLRAAEETRRAAGAERLPALRLNGFFGLQGPNFSNGASVYSGVATLNIPVFNGGQTRSDEMQADAAVTQRRASLSAMQEDVRMEVRSAWIDVDTASRQLAVSDNNRTLAQQTLLQSMDRFKVGAADSVEVVQSQEALASAEQDYINSLFSLRLAQMKLARAVGAAEEDVPRILKGGRS